MADSLVIIPTYNEIENIRNIIEAVFNQEKDFHVLIIDDGSPDGTADIVKDLQKKYKDRLFLLERSGKLGLGTAYIAGFKWGLRHHYDYLIEMDADFSHDPKDLIRLYKACSTGNAQVSVGSRYVKGGKVVNWPWDRIFLSYGASLYTRLMTWMPVKDPTAGFVCYKRCVLEQIDLDKIEFIGYAFQIEMKFASISVGSNITEVPITFKDREAGQSKMSIKIIQEAIFGVIKMRFKSFFRSYKPAGAPIS